MWTAKIRVYCMRFTVWTAKKEVWCVCGSHSEPQRLDFCKFLKNFSKVAIYEGNQYKIRIANSNQYKIRNATPTNTKLEIPIPINTKLEILISINTKFEIPISYWLALCVSSFYSTSLYNFFFRNNSKNQSLWFTMWTAKTLHLFFCESLCEPHTSHPNICKSLCEPQNLFLKVDRNFFEIEFWEEKRRQQ